MQILISEEQARRIFDGFEEIDRLKTCPWQSIDFIEGEVDGNGLEQLIVTVDGVEITPEAVNLKAQFTRIGKIQLHIFISPELQRIGIGTKIYISFIHQFGGIYSGYGRVQNPDGILGGIYRKLSHEPDITVCEVPGADGKPIGVEAVLASTIDEAFDRHGYFNVKSQLSSPIDIKELRSIEHVSRDRADRIANINNIGDPEYSFVVDTGHWHGEEIHTITDRAKIVISNKQTKELLTVIAARPAQIQRYWVSLRKRFPNDQTFSLIMRFASNNVGRGKNRI